jgi:hypothetical protein
MPRSFYVGLKLKSFWLFIFILKAVKIIAIFVYVLIIQ